MRYFNFYFLFFIASVLLLSCEKNSELTMAQLVKGVWHITELKEDKNDNGDFSGEGENQINSCKGDDIFMFEDGGVLTINHGIICFNQIDSQTVAKWDVSENDSLLIFTVDSDIDTMKIASISKNKMILHEIDGERIELIAVLEK